MVTGKPPYKTFEDAQFERLYIDVVEFSNLAIIYSLIRMKISIVRHSSSFAK